jgi:hypothetical protein
MLMGAPQADMGTVASLGIRGFPPDMLTGRVLEEGPAGCHAGGFVAGCCTAGCDCWARLQEGGEGASLTCMWAGAATCGGQGGRKGW